MSLCRRKLEHLFEAPEDKPWQKKHDSKMHKWLKKQLSRFIRRNKLNEDIVNRKRPTADWQY